MFIIEPRFVFFNIFSLFFYCFFFSLSMCISCITVFFIIYSKQSIQCIFSSITATCSCDLTSIHSFFCFFFSCISYCFFCLSIFIFQNNCCLHIISISYV
nr:MAG TPA: hypothetical protein [Caudoviricetes sp.]